MLIFKKLERKSEAQSPPNYNDGVVTPPTPPRIPSMHPEPKHSPPSSRNNAAPPQQNTNSSSGDVSLSIEETNKIRIKLGLKPLEVCYNFCLLN